MKKKNTREFLGEQNIPSLLLKMSLPAMIGMIVMTLYNIVDSIFIGQKFGSLGLGAVGIVFPLMMIVIAISMGFGIGASSIISRKLGEKKEDDAQKVFGNFLSFVILVSLIMSILGIIFVDKLLVFLGSSQNILPYAKAYLVPILFGLIFQTLSASLTNIVRSVGNSKTAMFSMVIGAIINIFLDYIFLFVYDFGIEGAAYATVISQLISTIYLLFYFFSKNSLLKFKLLPFEFQTLKSISIIGFPSFIRQGSMSFIGILVNHVLLDLGGDIAIAAYGIMFRILMILVLPSMGIMQGSQPIIGYNYGAKKFDRVKETLILSIKVSSIIVFVSFLLIYIFPDFFIKLFTTDNNLIEFTRNCLLIMFIGMPLIGFQFISQGYFQAIGKAREALILSLLRQVICFLPFLIILPIFFGLEGVWYVYPLADFFASIITFFMMKSEFSKL